MKRIFAVYIFLLSVLAATAHGQQEGQFSPEKYQAELEQFITKEACLTPQEAASFFPLYREMQKKQRTIFDQMKNLSKIKPTNEKGCREAIRKRDDMDIELKQIQQTYHNKFLSVLPASKLYDVIKAEDHFHRKMLKNWRKGPGPHRDNKGEK